MELELIPVATPATERNLTGMTTSVTATITVRTTTALSSTARTATSFTTSTKNAWKTRMCFVNGRENTIRRHHLPVLATGLATGLATVSGVFSSSFFFQFVTKVRFDTNYSY